MTRQRSARLSVGPSDGMVDGGVRSWVTPLMLSIYLLPMPGNGVQLMPVLLLVFLCLDSRIRFHWREPIIFSALVCAILVLTLIQPGKITFFATLIFMAVITRFMAASRRRWNLLPTLYLHSSMAGISLLSLSQFGYDILPNIFWGESRHWVHANEFVSFRVSGLYQEPSTFAVHMLLMAMWADQVHRRRPLISLAFALLAAASFSSISIIAAIKILLSARRILGKQPGIFILPLILTVIAFLMRDFYLFFSEKLFIYSERGWQAASRFEALFFTLDKIAMNEFNFFLGHTTEVLHAFVIYDLGLVLSTLMIMGMPGLFVIAVFLVRFNFSLLGIAVIVITKVTIGNPLLWVATCRPSAIEERHCSDSKR